MNEQGVYRTALYYGTLGGIAVFAFHILLYISHINIFGPASVLGIWIPVVFLVKATLFHRKQNLAGHMTYRQGISIGFFTTAFHVLLFGLAFYLFGVLYAGDLVEMYRSSVLDSLQAGSVYLSEKIINQTRDSIELTNIGNIAYGQAFLKLVGGIVTTFITAAIFRNTRQTPDPL